MKIAVDIDGVVAATVPEMKRVANDMGLSLQFTQYAPIIRGVGYNDKIISDIVHFLFSSRMHTIGAYRDAVEVLPKIKKDIGHITFITARQKQYTDITKKWLRDYFSFPFQLVHLGSSNKPEFVKKEGFAGFIEDRLRTANQAAAMGINTYLMTRQWNSKRELHPAVKKQRSMEKVYQDLLLIKEGLHAGQSNN